jgi:hypothetical protein
MPRTPFDYAIMAQHTGRYAYLRKNLRCDGGGGGSCGDDIAKTGTGLMVFPASGSQTSYPSPCSAVVVPVLGVQANCLQTNSLLPDTGGWDGAKPCGRNYDIPTGDYPADRLTGSNLQRFPRAGSWVDWPGKWGTTDSSPGSPGPRDTYSAPWVSERADANQIVDPCTQQGGRRGTRSVSSLPDPAASACGPWFGTQVSVLVCQRVLPDCQRARRSLRLVASSRLLVSL